LKIRDSIQRGYLLLLFQNDGLHQSVLYTLTSLDAEPKVLLDPNTLSEDGTVALSGLSISEDGLRMVYVFPHLAQTGKSGKCGTLRQVKISQTT